MSTIQKIVCEDTLGCNGAAMGAVLYTHYNRPLQLVHIKPIPGGMVWDSADNQLPYDPDRGQPTFLRRRPPPKIGGK